MKTTNRKKTPKRLDEIPLSYETALYGPVLSFLRGYRDRIIKHHLDAFRAEHGHILKVAPVAYSPLDPGEIDKDPNVKRFIARFTAQMDASAKTARFTMGQQPADEWDVKDNDTYSQIIYQQIELCQATLQAVSDACGMEADAFKKRIRNESLIRQQAGQTILEFTKTLEKFFNEDTAWRARRIAHTESARSHNYGILRGLEHEDEVIGYEWVVSDDACKLCMELGYDDSLEPRKVAKGSAFLVDLRKKTPAIYQRVLAPPAHPNCRCAIAPVMDFEGLPARRGSDWIDEDGKFIRSTVTGPAMPPNIDINNPPVYVAPPRKPRAPRKPKAPAPGPAAPEIVVPTITWPDSPTADVQVIKQLGGSTGAELVKSNTTGELFVRKKATGTRADHLRSEYAADELYRAFGRAIGTDLTPESKLYETTDGVYKLARYLPDAITLAEAKAKDTKLYNRAINDLKRTYAFDAVMGNWDVFGATGDNIMVTPDGRPWRIDNGGALLYRAQGSLKSTLGPDLFSDHPFDLWTMDDGKINNTTLPKWMPLTDTERYASMKYVKDALRAAGGLFIPSSVPAGVGATITARVASMSEASDEYQMLTEDIFNPQHANTFARASMEMRAANVWEHVAKSSMKATYRKGDNYSSGYFKDDKGRDIEGFYGDSYDPESPWCRYLNMTDNIKGVDTDINGKYMKKQAESSSSERAMAVKQVLVTKATTVTDPKANIYWHEYNMQSYENAVDYAQRYYTGEESKLLKSMAYQHAYTYNLLRRLPLEQKSPDNNRIGLHRSVDRPEISGNGNQTGDKNVLSKRGFAESFGVNTFFGSRLSKISTIQSVPLHRCLVSYFQGQRRGNSQALLGISESEIVVMHSSDIPYDIYTGQHGYDNLPQLVRDKAKNSSGTKP